jgi:hypothetical protein
LISQDLRIWSGFDEPCLVRADCVARPSVGAALCCGRGSCLAARREVWER